MTETFAHVSFTSSIPQFKKTIFTIQTGKRLSKKLTEIRFEFETVTVVFNVSPLLKVKWTVMEGKQSYPHELESLRSYSFINEEAYVKIFKDFIAGDQTLFPSAMEIEATWKLVDQIKQLNRLPKLYQHEKDLLGEQYE
jgi:glucose-6-phosphate 1-dehydrogenase